MALPSDPKGKYVQPNKCLDYHTWHGQGHICAHEEALISQQRAISAPWTILRLFVLHCYKWKFVFVKQKNLTFQNFPSVARVCPSSMASAVLHRHYCVSVSEASTPLHRYAVLPTWLHLTWQPVWLSSARCVARCSVCHDIYRWVCRTSQIN